MHTTTAKTIYPLNAHLARQSIEVYDPAVNRYVPFVGGSFVVSFATADDGTGPIAGLQNIPMAAVAGALGSYFVVIQSTTLAPLIALDGTTVYQIVSGGPSAALRVTTPMVVNVVRYAQ